MELFPSQVVGELDRYIVGQSAAKRALAIALRTRIRRSRLPLAEQVDITPKNIMLIGPTGVGKTELARRLAELVEAPFVKVEATKFTEVGYVGRDVESMVRDLVENAVRMVREERVQDVSHQAQARVEERILQAMLPRQSKAPVPFEKWLGLGEGGQAEDREQAPAERAQSEDLKRRLQAGELEELLIEVELDEKATGSFDLFANAGLGDLAANMQEMLGNLLPQKKRRRKLTVEQARVLLLNEEVETLLDANEVALEALKRAEQLGIIFIDEIDKIVGHSQGPDVSREGVQRDILPIVEGSTVATKYGPVKTDHILFIAAGAFHVSQPADLIPELQGRFPIRVELDSLSEEDLAKILVQPENALLKQYARLLGTEGIRLEFTDGAVKAMAEIAQQVNATTVDIGARRLHTVLEQVLDEVSFDTKAFGTEHVVIDDSYVRERLQAVLKGEDYSRFIL